MHSCHEVLHCCPMPAHRPVRKLCSRPVRPQVSDAARLAQRNLADSLLLICGAFPVRPKDPDPGRATHMVAPDAASGRRGTCPDWSERGGVEGAASEGSRRDRGAIGAPHPCSWTSYNKKADHHCRMIYIYIDVPERWVITIIILLVDTSKKRGPLGGRVFDRGAPEVATTLQLLQHTYAEWLAA